MLSVEHMLPSSVASPAAQASTIVYKELVTLQELHALLCQLSQSTSSIYSRLKVIQDEMEGLQRQLSNSPAVDDDVGAE